MTILLKPTVVILGATGQIGRFILERLKQEPDAVHIRVAARRPEQVAAFQQQGWDAVLLDLDRPATFAAALHAVDRVFLLTGYTVAMLAQSKTFIDAARKARPAHGAPWRVRPLGLHRSTYRVAPVGRDLHRSKRHNVDAHSSKHVHGADSEVHEDPQRSLFSILGFRSHGLDRMAGYRRGCSHGSARRTSETQWAKLLA